MGVKSRAGWYGSLEYSDGENTIGPLEPARRASPSGSALDQVRAELMARRKPAARRR